MMSQEALGKFCMMKFFMNVFADFSPILNVVIHNT
jgi:hypothetical protein